MTTPVQIEMPAWEAVTSLGECAAETALLWEAGAVNLAPSRFVGDDGARIAMCSSPALTPALLGTDRLLELAGLALERLVRVPEAGLRQGMTLLLCLPEHLAGGSNTFALSAEGQALVHALAQRPSLASLQFKIEPFPFGRAAGALSLQRATELVAAGQSVLWGGVDSQHDWQLLKGLAADDRLLTQENVDGIRPGEAAAFAVLQQTRGSTTCPVVMGIGLGRQAAPSETQPASRAEGLARAVRAATSLLRDQHRRCGHWLFDTTHEVVATQHLQHVLTACADIVGLRTSLHAPLKTLGDAGAASLSLFAVLAAEAWKNGSADDDTALLAACSGSGACGAILLGESIARSQP